MTGFVPDIISQKAARFSASLKEGSRRSYKGILEPRMKGIEGGNGALSECIGGTLAHDDRTVKTSWSKRHTIFRKLLRIKYHVD